MYNGKKGVRMKHIILATIALIATALLSKPSKTISISHNTSYGRKIIVDKYVGPTTKDNDDVRIFKEQLLISRKLLKSLPVRIAKRAESVALFIVHIADKYHIDPYLISAIIWAESNFNAFAESSGGAYGLMQITRNAALDMCKKVIKDISFKKCVGTYKTDVYLNIEIGTAFISKLLRKYSLKKAIIAYNEGESRMRRRARKNRKFGTKHRYFKRVSKYFVNIKNKADGYILAQNNRSIASVNNKDL